MFLWYRMKFTPIWRLWNNRHIPFDLSFAQSLAQNCITLMSPSKTFNNRRYCQFICSDRKWAYSKKIFELSRTQRTQSGNHFAYTATQAAYNGGEEWLNEMLQYIEANILYVSNFMHEHIPAIKVLKPDASFLVWLDCRDLHLSQTTRKAVYRKAHCTQ